MQALFILISFAGAGYFAVRKRRFDCFSLAYISSVFYFTPAYVGFVPTYATPPTTDMVSGVYVVYIAVLFGLIIAAILYDLMFGRPANDQPWLVYSGAPQYRNVLLILSAIAFTGFVGNLSSIDVGLLAGGAKKRDLLAANTLFYNFWVYPSIALCFLSYYIKSWWFFGLALALLLLDLVLYAMRVHMVIALMAVFFYHLASQERARLILKVKLSVFLVPIVLIFFVFKSIIQPLRQGDYGLFFERLISGDTYLYWLSRAEPFNQAAILNAVIDKQFVSPVSQIYQAFLSFLPYSSSLDLNITPRFHDYFQPELFPHILGHIGNNPWAQMLSAGGWPLLLVAITCYVLLIFFVNYRIFYCSGEVIRVALLLTVPILCFYMQRNDLYFTFVMFKRLFVIFIFSYLLVSFCRQLLLKRICVN